MPSLMLLIATKIDISERCIAAINHLKSSEPPWWLGSVATPFLAALLAMVGSWIAISFDRRKAVNQELIKKRIQIYDSMIPKANDLLCYFICCGAWKALKPENLLAHKRDLDRTRFIYGGLFSRDLVARYDAFIKTCFDEFTGRGEPAKLRANVDRLRCEWGGDWDESWNKCFARPEIAISKEQLSARYDALLLQFGIEIGAIKRTKLDILRSAILSRFAKGKSD